MVTPIHDFHCAYGFLAGIPAEPSKRTDSLKRFADQQVLRSYSQTVLQAVAETEITLMSFDQARSQCARLARAAEASRKAANSATIRFDRGLSTFSEALDAERGLPHAIRSDNGVPFASPNSLFNLSKLSVWWLRLGITIERIRLGHPQQNGRHERMHRTLKMEATRPADSNFLQQQAKFDAFVQEFNNERPHEALAMKYPADVYKPSARPYRGIGELSYPFHDRTALVTCCGRICIYKKKINLSTSLAGQAVGIKEVDDGIWLVSFMDYDLGYIDLEEKTLQPLHNPFGPKV